MDRRTLLAGLAAALPAAGGRPRAAVAQSATEPWPDRLIAAAERQVGRTLAYDPSYTRLDYPGGDVPLARGVCTDVVIRAYRTALGMDLQRLVHEDMRADFGAYPKSWGLRRPDPNIDHRRVPNLETFLRRRGSARSFTNGASDFQPGDLATQRLPGNLPHIMVVTGRRAASGRLLVVHNIGNGARAEDVLAAYPLAGRFRFGPG